MHKKMCLTKPSSSKCEIPIQPNNTLLFRQSYVPTQSITKTKNKRKIRIYVIDNMLEKAETITLKILNKGKIF